VDHNFSGQNNDPVKMIKKKKTELKAYLNNIVNDARLVANATDQLRPEEVSVCVWRDTYISRQISSSEYKTLVYLLLKN